VHRHQTSVDLPRAADGTPLATLHPARQHQDWRPLQAGDALFWHADGSALGFSPDDPEACWPVFINEAAYGEKGIALSLCRRESWVCSPGWAEALAELLLP